MLLKKTTLLAIATLMLGTLSMWNIFETLSSQNPLKTLDNTDHITTEKGDA